MSESELKISMKLDRSHARAALKEHTDDLDRVRGKAKEAGDAQEKGVVDPARKGEGAFRGLKNSAGEAFQGITVGAVAAGVGIAKLASIAQGLSDTLKQAGERYRDFSRQHNDQKDGLRELAGIMGVKADSKFAIDNAKFNVGAMMNRTEGLAYRTQFQNSGAQYAGKTMSAADFGRFEQLGAQLATAKGLEPTVAGDFFGSVAGMKDFSKAKDPAAEALGVANSVISVLGRGKGANAQLVKQASMVNSALFNEDEFKGVIQDPNEAAALVSVMAEYNPEEAATMTKAVVRGLRDFKGKPAALLAEAGVKANMTPIQQIRALAPKVLEKARLQGVKPSDILRENFEDIQTVSGLDVAINKGVEGGGFDDRMSFASKNSGADAAMTLIKEYAGGESGAKRIADAQIELARAGIGAKGSKIDVLRREASAKLLNEGALDSSSAAVKEFVLGKIPFADLGSASTVIDQRVDKLIHDRAPRMGLWEGQDSGSKPMIGTAEWREGIMNAKISAIEGAGGSVFQTMEEALRENTRVVAENNAIMRQQAGGNVPPPLQPAPPNIRRP